MKNILNKIKKNNKGVSEVVAVLVLVAVVIVGAIGVGTIMSSFSTQVSDQASAGDVGKNAGTELVIAGSTTVQPLSECIAKLYMKANPGVRVTVQGGGSGAGITSAGMGLVDIGAASKDLTAAEKAKYPDLQTIKIGGSGVVVIASPKCAPQTATVNATDLKKVYNSTGNITLPGLSNNVDTAYQRAESSGTEEVFAAYIKFQGSDKQLSTEAKATGVTGNAGMLKAVQDCGTTKCCIGFVDYGFTLDANGKTLTNIQPLNVTDSNGEGSYVPTGSNIKEALKGTTGKYPADLIRPLNYVTSGSPSSIAQSFISYATQPGDRRNPVSGQIEASAAGCFEETGYFAVWEFA